MFYVIFFLDDSICTDCRFHIWSKMHFKNSKERYFPQKLVNYGNEAFPGHFICISGRLAFFG